MRLTISEPCIVRAGYHLRGAVKADDDSQTLLFQLKDFGEDGQPNWERVTRITPDKRLEKYSLQSKHVLVAARGSDHFAWAPGEDRPEVIVSSHFLIVSCDTGIILPKYLAWYINLPATQANLKRMVQGTNIQMVSKQALDELSIEAPPIEVQESIATLADLATEEKRLMQTLVEKRERLLGAVGRDTINRIIEEEEEQGLRLDT